MGRCSSVAYRNGKSFKTDNDRDDFFEIGTNKTLETEQLKIIKALYEKDKDPQKAILQGL